jgi:hypothetical protein
MIVLEVITYLKRDTMRFTFFTSVKLNLLQH